MICHDLPIFKNKLPDVAEAATPPFLELLCRICSRRCETPEVKMERTMPRRTRRMTKKTNRLLPFRRTRKSPRSSRKTQRRRKLKQPQRCGWELWPGLEESYHHVSSHVYHIYIYNIQKKHIYLLFIHYSLFVYLFIY